MNFGISLEEDALNTGMSEDRCCETFNLQIQFIIRENFCGETKFVTKLNNFRPSTNNFSHSVQGIALDSRGATKQEKWVNYFKRRTSLKKTTSETRSRGVPT